MMILELCDNGDILKIMSFVRIALLIIRIVVPIILIISLMINYVSAVASKDSDALAKANKSLVSKSIAAILVFFIPTFVNLISEVSLVDSKLYLSCIENATHENIVSAYKLQAEKSIDAASDNLTRGYYLIAKRYVNKIPDENEKAVLSKELEEVEKYIKIRESIYIVAKNYSSEDYNKVKQAIDSITDEEVKEKLLDELKEAISNMNAYSYNANPSDPKYGGLKPIKDPNTLSTILAQNGSSVEKLNLQIQTAVDTAGVGTRQAPVMAGLTLIDTLAEYGYYINYQWGGKRYKLGVSGNWGSVTGAKSCGSYPGGEDACHQTQKYSGLDCSGFVNWALVQGFRDEKTPVQGTGRSGPIGGTSLAGQTTAICNVGDVLVSSGHIVMVAGIDDANKRYIIIESGGGHGGVGMAYKSYNDGDYSCRKINYSN